MSKCALDFPPYFSSNSQVMPKATTPASSSFKSLLATTQYNEVFAQLKCDQWKAENITTFEKLPAPGCLCEVPYPVDASGAPISPHALFYHIKSHDFDRLKCFHDLPVQLFLLRESLVVACGHGKKIDYCHVGSTLHSTDEMMTDSFLSTTPSSLQQPGMPRAGPSVGEDMLPYEPSHLLWFSYADDKKFAQDLAHAVVESNTETLNEVLPGTLDPTHRDEIQDHGPLDATVSGHNASASTLHKYLLLVHFFMCADFG
ncbi:hypothetical protein L208DRAFT_1379197 [Tricholoma matsutake]|nr:hypothetical protein L208DRAFT_1379197 [Tricholoma matsutake 945]